MSWNLRRDPFTGQQAQHDGIDLPFGMNDSMGSMQDGTVTNISNDPSGYGWYVDVKHDDGTTGRYAHANVINKGVGQRVERGEELGLIGSTGRSTGPHVHFEHHDKNGTPMDPRPFVAAAGTPMPNNLGGPKMATALPLSMEDYITRAQALTPKAEVSPELQQMMMQNMQQRSVNLPLALGAMLSGDKGLQGVGGSIYKDAMDARNPQALGDEGFFDPQTGKFIASPIASNRRNEKVLEIGMKAYQSAEDAAARREQTAAQQALTNSFSEERIRLSREADARAKREEDERNATRESNRPQPLIRRESAPITSTPGVPDATPTASTVPDFTPREYSRIPDLQEAGVSVDGSPLLRATKGELAGSYWISNGNSLLEYDTRRGVVDQASWSKQTAAAKDAASAGARIEGLIADVKANPSAFTVANSAVTTALPNALANRVMNKMNTPESMRVRTTLLQDAGQMMNDLYGAAQSLGEAKRASQFIVQDGDSPQTIVTKLEAAAKYQDYLKNKYGPAFSKAVEQQRANSGQQAPTSTPAATDSTGAASVEDLIKLYGGVK